MHINILSITFSIYHSKNINYIKSAYAELHIPKTYILQEYPNIQIHKATKILFKYHHTQRALLTESKEAKNRVTHNYNRIIPRDVTKGKHISRLPTPLRGPLHPPPRDHGTSSITVNEIRDRSLRHNLKHLIPRVLESRGAKGSLRASLPRRGILGLIMRRIQIPFLTLPRGFNFRVEFGNLFKKYARQFWEAFLVTREDLNYC